jgi:hypothetical protein
MRVHCAPLRPRNVWARRVTRRVRRCDWHSCCARREATGHDEGGDAEFRASLPDARAVARAPQDGRCHLLWVLPAWPRWWLTSSRRVWAGRCGSEMTRLRALPGQRRRAPQSVLPCARAFERRFLVSELGVEAKGRAAGARFALASGMAEGAAPARVKEGEASVRTRCGRAGPGADAARPGGPEPGTRARARTRGARGRRERARGSGALAGPASRPARFVPRPRSHSRSQPGRTETQDVLRLQRVLGQVRPLRPA